MRANRPARDDNSLNELVRSHLHQRPVFACPGLTFIGVAKNIFGLGGFLGNETPFHPGRKARAASATHVGFLHFVDDLLGREFLERAFEPFVAVVFDVNIELVRFGNAKKSADYRHLGGMPVMNRTRCRLGSYRPRTFVQSVQQIVGAAFGEIFVEVIIDLHGRRAGAGANALHFLKRKHAVGGDLLIPDLQLLLHEIVDFIAAPKHAGDIRAYLNVKLAHRFSADHGVVGERFGHVQRTQTEALGNLQYQVIAHVAKSILRIKSHRYERRALHGVTCDECLEFLFQ